MLSISVKEFLVWKKKQLSKGGDQQSFTVLLDCLGGISNSNLNLISINPEGILYLKKMEHLVKKAVDQKEENLITIIRQQPKQR